MAIKGTSVDYTEAPMRHAIVLLAVPMVLEAAIARLAVGSGSAPLELAPEADSAF